MTISRRSRSVGSGELLSLRNLIRRGWTTAAEQRSPGSDRPPSQHSPPKRRPRRGCASLLARRAVWRPLLLLLLLLPLLALGWWLFNWLAGETQLPDAPAAAMHPAHAAQALDAATLEGLFVRFTSLQLIRMAKHADYRLRRVSCAAPRAPQDEVAPRPPADHRWHWERRCGASRWSARCGTAWRRPPASRWSSTPPRAARRSSPPPLRGSSGARPAPAEASKGPSRGRGRGRGRKPASGLPAPSPSPPARRPPASWSSSGGTASSVRCVLCVVWAPHRARSSGALVVSSES
eukprot:scaffold2002_cov328-Prasinococcus_capsulatus_cf.AAC.5